MGTVQRQSDLGSAVSAGILAREITPCAAGQGPLLKIAAPCGPPYKLWANPQAGHKPQATLDNSYKII